MKIENIPADIKSKSLKEAREEINEILTKLESDNSDLSGTENTYKRLIYLNKESVVYSNIYFQVFLMDTIC